MQRTRLRITFAMYRPGLAGGTRVTAKYAGELARRGHEVRIIALGAEKPSLRTRIHQVLWSRATPVRPKLSPYLVQACVPVQLIEHTEHPTQDDFPDADIVIATFWRTAHWIEHLPPSKGKKAYFIQHHEVHPYFDTQQVEATYKMPLHKITISKWLQDTMAQRYGSPNVPVIHNSVDTEQFYAPVRAKADQPTVGLMYSEIYFKGIQDSLKALENVRKRIPNLRVIAFGLVPPSEKNPLPPNSEFHLCPPQESIRDLYAQCDVWLCGSLAEGFHLPPLEAMACRCPVVSTKVGGPIDLIKPGYNGFLVDVHDVEGLAKHTVDVLSVAPERWREMSDAAYQTATGYTWSDATDRFEQALLDIVGPLPASKRRSARESGDPSVTSDLSVQFAP